MFLIFEDEKTKFMNKLVQIFMRRVIEQKSVMISKPRKGVTSLELKYDYL